MSTWEHVDVPCARCGAVSQAPILRGIHITSLPHVKQQLRDGRFQRHACPACGFDHQIETSSVYTDFDLHHYVAVEPPGHADWRTAVAHHRAIFDRSFTLGPPVAEELAAGMRRRLVFGVRALREKVLLWDADMDDRAVEIAKAELLGRRGVDPGAEELRVSAVLPSGHLLCARLGPAPADGAAPVLLGHVPLPRDLYDQALRGALAVPPGLGATWVVDVFVGATGG